MPLLAECPHGGHIGKIEFGDLDVGVGISGNDAIGGLLGPLDVPAGEHHAGTASGELLCRLPANAGIGACHDHSSAIEHR